MSQPRKRIAIDCRPLVGPRAGIGRYLYRLLEEFAGREDEVEYYLYAPRPFSCPEACRNHPGFHVRMVHFRPALLWLHLVVPLWLWQDRIDIFFGPNYAAPLIRFHEYRCVITVHDAVYVRYPETMLWKTRLHNQLAILSYAREADMVLTDSHFSAGELHDVAGIERAKLRVVHLAGERAPQAEERATRPRGLRRPYMLSVGTVEPRKNQAVLVKAYAGLSQEIRDRYDLVLIGRTLWGGLDPRSWFEEAGIVDRAHHFADVADEELSAFFAGAAVFVFPSFYEGFGLPVMEAMSHGVPVICSYTSSIGEAAGDAALLMDPANCADLTAKLELVLQDSTLAATLRQSGLRRAAEFTWAGTAAQTFALLLSEGEIS